MATMVRIPVSLPKTLKDKLTTLREEGYSVAGYLRHLAENDIKAREEVGWRSGKGWDTPEYRESRRDLAKMKRRDASLRALKRRRTS